ncbi:MAG TPA: type II and III secretion system protein family protein [Vicinamibacterales bacterium]|nr:type II and III secretion system protein family protein [Vicinamibacterales bacterium]
MRVPVSYSNLRLAGVAVLVALCASPMAAQQGEPGPRVVAAPAAEATDSSGFERVLLTAGRSTVVATAFDITRIAVTNPAVADATVVQPREVLVDGKAAGTVSLIVWGAHERHQYDVVVDPGVTALQQTFQKLFPGEDIRVAMNDESIILTGSVSSNAVMLRAGEIAQGTSSKAHLVNLLQLPGGSESQQVMLQVRVAEVNRRAVQELGVNFFSTRVNATARTTTQQFPAPDFDDSKPGGLVFSDFLNLFFFNRQEGLGVAIKALEQKGLFQSLAEPNLIAYNGQEASFLAGGEFPVPIVQGATGTVTVMFKEFGVRLNFRPTIAGDVIRLKVRPEVSSLDFNNGITLQGFRIPSLISRRAETDVELRDGQSFAIAGLLSNLTQNDGANVPFLSSIPIIGYLFKSNADRRERTELMVLVTPRLVRPLNPDEVPPLPTQQQRFLQPPDMPKPGRNDK